MSSPLRPSEARCGEIISLHEKNTRNIQLYIEESEFQNQGLQLQQPPYQHDLVRGKSNAYNKLFNEIYFGNYNES